MRISVVGGGYVGLVSSVCLAEMGHQVDLIEIEPDKVALINSGRPTLYENGLHSLLSANIGSGLRAGTDYDIVSRSDISLICVGTPPAADGGADLSMVRSASRSIGESLRISHDYHVVAVKSTVPPGTTNSLVMPEVLRASKKSTSDVGFVMNPEFLREGLAIEDFMHPDRIVIGSNDAKAGDFFEAIYDGLKAPRIRTGLAAAEMIKYASNAFLATKISFSNEIGNICKLQEIDVYEVMRGVGLDHRIAPHFLNAGVGFGGSCFPKDVSALVRLAQNAGEDCRLLRSVMEINDQQPLRMVKLLEKKKGPLKGKRIAIIGLAFKNDTDDVRESRAIPVIRELLQRGAEIRAYDPMANESMRRIFPEIEYCQKAGEALREADGCLIMTEWPQFEDLDHEFDLMHSRVIIEGRRILKCRDAEGICW
jgi:UDPglucose 6-dehydrogenase